MTSEESQPNDCDRHQTIIDRPSNAASRTSIADDEYINKNQGYDGRDISSGREISLPEKSDEIPEPDSAAVQAAAAVGRAALAPMLVEMGEIDEIDEPTGQHHSIAKEIADTLDIVAQRGYPVGTVFKDWLDLLLYSFADGNHEAAYQRTAQRYGFKSHDQGERGIDYLSQATGQLFEAVLKTGADILGDVYHILGKNNNELGQFFTPHNVAKHKVDMVDITGDMTTEYDRGDRYPEAINSRLSVMDPACGSGRLLVAAARNRPDAWYAGVDLDAACAKMAALNLVFCNVDGQIVHGNSLTMEAYTVYNTYYTESGGVLSIGDPEERPTVLDE